MHEKSVPKICKSTAALSLKACEITENSLKLPLLGSGCWKVLCEDNPDFCENAFPHLSHTYGFFFS